MEVLAARSPDESGRVLGDYALQERLAEGGCSEVWRARHVGSGEEVVVKRARTPEERQVLVRERQVLASLDHPHIVRLLDGDAGEDAIVLELLPGNTHTLRDLLAAGPLAPEQAASLFSDLLQGLASAHRRGVQHLDLKPENLLLAERDGKLRAVVSDFGLASNQPEDAERLQLSMALRTKVFAGTLAYMAPEQRQGIAGDARSDVFSAGLILFEMLTGRLPEPGDSLREACPKAPEELQRVFEGCYCARARRYASANNVLLALQQSALPLRAATASSTSATEARASAEEVSMRQTYAANTSKANRLGWILIATMIVCFVGAAQSKQPACMLIVVPVLIALGVLSSQLNKCPSCRTSVARRTRHCPHCGFQLQA